MSENARVLGAEDYSSGAKPYQVERVGAEFLEQLRRQREPKKEPAKAAEDPLVLKARADAEAIRTQAAQALKDAQAKAEAIEAEARERSRREAESAAKAAADEGRRTGLAEGRAEGEAQGRAEGKAAYAADLERMGSLLEAAVKEKEAYFSDREALLVELALRVAAKVIHREVKTRRDHIQNLLRQAVQSLAERSKLQVTVHPDDLERLSQAQREGLLNLKGLKSIEFLADDKIMAGGLRVTSGYQTLDAALDSQLAEICRGLLEEAYHEGD